MNPEIVDKIEKWLTANAELYINKYPDDFEEYNLKLNHSFRVKNEIDKIKLDYDEKIKEIKIRVTRKKTVELETEAEEEVEEE